MNELKDILETNNEIKKQLNEVQNSILAINEKANQNNVDIAINKLKKDFCYSVSSYLNDNLEKDLFAALKTGCKFDSQCKNLFKEVLKENINNISKNNLDNDYEKELKVKISQMRLQAPLDECNHCFDNIENVLFDSNALLGSLNGGETNSQKILSPLNKEIVLKNVLEPLANKQRLEILEALALENKSHSQLSKLTGLAGGNLVFHLEKLQKAGLILQMHNRGDYMISKKGFALILMLNKIQELFNEN